jgi:transcriptional regulator with XRE-family HTH domain
VNFSEQIKKIRTNNKITQQQMADKLGISRQAISNWENDRNLPDIEMLITIAQVFNITLDELILGGIDMNNMTEKLIKDGSENNKIKMNLSGIKIGISLITLGIITYLVGIIAPPSTENFFAMTSSSLIYGGLITFFVIGIKNIFGYTKNIFRK